MSTPHLEVIPRIIDSSISASYQKNEPKQNEEPTPPETPKVEQVIAPVAITFTQKFFRTLKDYMIPILFIIAVIVIAYIVWTYFTKYRNKTTEEQSPDPPLVPEIQDKPDLSKYVFDEEESSNEESSNEEYNDNVLSIIAEESENDESKEESEEEFEEESENESNTDDNLFEIRSKHSNNDEDKPLSLITEPDLNVISNLINQPIDDTYIMEDHRQFDYADETPGVSENDEESIFTLLPESDKPKTKRTRKPKRVIL